VAEPAGDGNDTLVVFVFIGIAGLFFLGARSPLAWERGTDRTGG